MPWGGRWPGWMTAVYSALDLYASVVLLIAASAVMGQGILCLCGRSTWSWLSPAVGLAALIILAGAAIRLPGDDLTATAVVGVAMVAAIVVLWIRRPEAPGALRAGLPVAIAIVAAASIAFVVAGGFGAFEGKSSDLGYYLYDAQWLEMHTGFEPSHIVKGFPMGPPALAAVTSNAAGDASLVATFTAFTITVAVAGALAALAVFGELGLVRRTVAAFLVGLPYMGASFFVQSSFKELAVGLFALAFALLLRELAAEERHREDAGSLAVVVPMALIAGAAVYTYSFAGLYWMLGTLGVWLLGSAVFGRRRLRAQFRGWRLQVPRTRRAKILVLVAALAVVAVAIPEFNQVVEFARARGALSALSGGAVSGDLPGSPRLFTALGVWPVTDYRTAVPNLWAERILVAAALIVLARGLFGLWRRRELAILAATVTGMILYLAARIGSGPYVQSKAIAVMAPLIMLVAVYGAASPLSAPGLRGVKSAEQAPAGQSGGRRPGARSLAWGAIAVVFAFGALGSTYLALAGALVNDGTQSRQLEFLGSKIKGSTVIFLGSDDYIGWELRGAEVFSPGRRSGVGYLPPKSTSTWTRYDFDSMNSGELDAAQYVIAARSPMMSETPPNFRLVAATDSFVLWRRIGPTRSRETFVEHALPGDLLRCSSPSGRRLSRARGVARVWSPAPVHGLAAEWKASSPVPASKGFRRHSALVQGRSLSQGLRLGRGRWAISLQYHSAEPVQVRGAGLDVRLPPNSQRLGAFWPVGTIVLKRPGTVTFTVGLEPLPGFRDMLAGPGRLNTGSPGLLAGIGATAIGGRATVPLGRACGRFVDWYRKS